MNILKSIESKARTFLEKINEEGRIRTELLAYQKHHHKKVHEEFEKLSVDLRINVLEFSSNNDKLCLAGGNGNGNILVLKFNRLIKNN